ncbi:hypothetical protein OAO01_04180 [Oligoflexia bacterium]|nr:hypothetical protein [Oligoflexia bacterium]
MKVTPDNLVAQLLFGNQSHGSRKGGPLVDGSKIAELAKSSGGLKKAAEAAASTDAAEVHISEPPHDPIPITEPAPEAPVEETEVAAPVEPVSEDNSVQSLAERYVALYEKNSGNDLSSDEEQAKIQEVANFYGRDAGHQERLQTLVTSLEA